MIATWWNQQTLRDRRVLIIGAIVVAIFLVWSFIWHPLAAERERLASQLDNARRDLAFVRVAEAEVDHLRNAGVRSRADRQGKSLLALADVSARGAGLEGVLKRLEPVGPNSVRASFEFASFDTLMAWIESLARDYGVQITDFSADRVDATGLVNARVTLEDIP
ncbi:MAG TPA: type II secretion system protein M [Dokdonella sp.]|uniref:type II secretion system protein M n=1 Tax=Dokdonella sp. TaxID=2291710 RepID=UPI002D7F826F|nr:type II secretion system protein M [Dokdonella sp.]HET9033001.1 type II secretion system protein M [Dokdonella sp.]